ncbi:MAG: hypothetical protein OXL37_00565 [Chloroflexota bacterium]|nr:hypothetical protein [Chloroflexota bacterium]MDE2959068.1 hypothetical protein [Chloroflexota bacterium]
MSSNPISDNSGIDKQEGNKTPTDRTDEGAAVVELAYAIYEAKIRHLVEPERHGEYLTIDVKTGEYEVDADSLAANLRMLKRHSAETLVSLRIGYPAFGTFGMRVRPVSDAETEVVDRRTRKTLSPAPGHEHSVVSQAIAIYDAKIRHLVEPKHHGEYLALDVKTEEYDFDTDSLAANARMLERHSPETLVLLRIGYPAFGTFVGWQGVF